MSIIHSPGHPDFDQEKYDKALKGNPKPGYVYLMQPKGHNVYKIGCTMHLEKRLQRKQNDILGVALEYVAVVWSEDYERLEQHLHRTFAAYHLAGEWFVLPDATVEWFKGLAK